MLNIRIRYIENNFFVEKNSEFFNRIDPKETPNYAPCLSPMARLTISVRVVGFNPFGWHLPCLGDASDYINLYKTFVGKFEKIASKERSS